MGSVDDSYRTSTGLQVDQDDLWAHYCDFLGFLWFSHAFIVNQNGHGKKKETTSPVRHRVSLFPQKRFNLFKPWPTCWKEYHRENPAKLDEDHVPILLQIKQVTCKRCQDFDGFCGLPLFLACRLQAKHEKYMCARVCETIPSSTKLGATGPAHLVSVVMKLSIVFWQISLAHVLFETHVITIWFCVWFWSSFSHSTFKFVGPKKVIKDGSGTCPIYRKTSRHKAFKESHRGCPIITLDDWRAILTRLCPPVISWFIIPINYRYIYHKP